LAENVPRFVAPARAESARSDTPAAQVCNALLTDGDCRAPTRVVGSMMGPGTLAMDETLVRANWMKFVIHGLKRTDEPVRGNVLSRIPDDVRAEIRVAGRLAWLPGRIFVTLAGAILAGVGPTGARTFWRRSLRDSIDVPFMRPLVHGALFLFGDTPAGLVRRTGQAWHLVTKNCGDFKAVETGEPNSIIYRGDNVAPSYRVPCLVPMWAGGLEGQIDWIGTEGTVETRSQLLEEQGTVEFVVRWKPKTR
jgi:hypothetical protein